MTTENLSTYSEVDGSARLSRTSTTETITGLVYNETAYSYKDFGASYFAGSQYFEGTLNISSATSPGSVMFTYGSTLGTYATTPDFAGVFLQYTGPNVSVYAYGKNGGTDFFNLGADIATGTTYYYRIGFLSALGQYGAAYYQIFSDSGRTTMVSSGFVQRPAATAYRYFYPAQSIGSAGAGSFNATNANITLFAPAAGEVVTGFTKVDPSTHIAQYADCAAVTTLGTNETAYLYKDYGAAHFAGNFTLQSTINVTAFASGTGQMLNLLSLVNTLGHANNTNDLQGIALNWISGTTYSLKAREVSGSTEYLSSASSTLTVGVPYFVQINRDTTVGTYGTIYVKVFSDPAYTVQVGATVSVTLHSTVSLRYLNVVQSYNTGVANSTTLTAGTVVVTLPPTNPSTISYTQADNTVAVTAFRANTASVGYTQANNTVAVTAAQNVPVFVVSVAQADNTVVATATLKIQASVAVIQADNTVAATVSTPLVTEQFSVRVRHKTTGAALTGLTTVTLTICDPVTGYRFDFADSTFKASPATPTKVLPEVSAANQPGLYRADVLTTVMSGWVEFEATYNDGTYTYSYPGEAYYVGGRRATGAWTTAQQTQVTEVQTRVIEVAQIHGLIQGSPLVVTPTTRTAGSISQSITGDGVSSSTITRL